MWMSKHHHYLSTVPQDGSRLTPVDENCLSMSLLRTHKTHLVCENFK